jgi:hypothetical protein
MAKGVEDNVYYSLGENFDNYKFSRRSVTMSDVDAALKTRVNHLRQKYDYIRLWYSGGKDCTLALNSFIKYQSKIDEIVIVRRHTKNTLGLYPEHDPLLEIDPVINELKLIQSQMPETKITIIDFDDKEMIAFYETPNWYLGTSHWFFSVGSAQVHLFQRYINSKLGHLKTHKNMCELVGGDAPDIVKTKNRWQFCYSTVGLCQFGPSIDSIEFEDFLTTEDDPSLIELHVNSIIDGLEKSGHTPQYLTDIREVHRNVREHSLFFKQFSYNRFQMPKHDWKQDLPTDDYFWHARQSSRTFHMLINRFYQNPIPKSIKLYIENTDWDLIRKNIEGNGFFTKTWQLD